MLVVLLTVSITMSLLLAMGIAFYVMTIPAVAKWYTKLITKQMAKVQDLFIDEVFDEKKEG